MIGIRRQRQIRTLTITLLIVVLLTAIMFIIGFKPIGIHKKNISEINIPRDTILYVSVRSIDNSVSKIVNSIYTHQIAHDKSLYDFAIMLKYIKVFMDGFLDKGFPIGTFSDYLFSRNASLLLWGTNQVNTTLESEWYFMFDVGYFANFAIKIMLANEEITILDNKYILNRVKYENIDIVSVGMDNKNSISLYFAIYNGRLIFTQKMENIKKIVDFFTSNTDKINKISNLKNIQTEFSPDLSLYIDYDGYKKLFNFKENTFLGDIKFSNLYGYMNLDDEKIDLNIHIISDNNSIKPNKIKQKITKYVSSSSPLYFGVSRGNNYLYTNISKYAIIDHPSLLKEIVGEFANIYKLDEIIYDSLNETSIFYITDGDNRSYPILAANIFKDEILIPKLEMSLLETSPNMKKTSISYDNQFIYTYELENNRLLSYTFIDDIFFFSKTEDTIKTLIDSYKDKNKMSSYFKKNKIDISDKNYLFKSDFKNIANLLTQLDSSLEVWSYPESVLGGVKISENITTIESRIYLNLKNIGE